MEDTLSWLQKMQAETPLSSQEEEPPSLSPADTSRLTLEEVRISLTRAGYKALVALQAGTARYTGESETRTAGNHTRLAAEAAVNGLNEYLASQPEILPEGKFRLLEEGEFKLASGEAAVYASLVFIEDDKKTPLLGTARREGQGLYAAAAAVLDAVNRKLDFFVLPVTTATETDSPAAPLQEPLQQRAAKTGPTLGVHLTAAEVRVMLLDTQGNTLAQATRPSLPTALPETVLHQVSSALQEAQAGDGSAAQICGIGIALAGRHRDGVCLESPEFPAWNEVSLVELADEQLKQPLLLVEDTKAALAAEAQAGAGVGLSNLLYCTGNGRLACAVMSEGKLLEGSSGAFASAAHWLLPDYTAANEGENSPVCECGQRSCWQSVASDSALLAKIKAKLARGRESALEEEIGRDPDSLTLGLLIETAEAGDPLTQEVFQEGAFWVGQALLGLMEVCDPEAVIVSGPALPDTMWMAHLRESLMKRPVGRRCPLLVSKWGRDGPITGAALLAREIAP